MTENGDIVNRNPRSVRVVGADNTAGEEAIRRMTRQRVDQAEEEAVHEDKELFGDAVSRSGLETTSGRRGEPGAGSALRGCEGLVGETV
jgi:hypothetical protein